MAIIPMAITPMAIIPMAIIPPLTINPMDFPNASHPNPPLTSDPPQAPSIIPMAIIPMTTIPLTINPMNFPNASHTNPPLTSDPPQAPSIPDPLPMAMAFRQLRAVSVALRSRYVYLYRIYGSTSHVVAEPHRECSSGRKLFILLFAGYKRMHKRSEFGPNTPKVDILKS